MVYLHLSCDDSIDWADNVYMELDADRWQTKVIEINKDGNTAYAYDDTECGTFLSEAQWPEPDAINGIEGYEGLHLEYITKEQFFNIWNNYVTVY